MDVLRLEARSRLCVAAAAAAATATPCSSGKLRKLENSNPSALLLTWSHAQAVSTSTSTSVAKGTWKLWWLVICRGGTVSSIYHVTTSGTLFCFFLRFAIPMYSELDFGEGLGLGLHTAAAAAASRNRLVPVARKGGEGRSPTSSQRLSLGHIFGELTYDR